MHALRAGTLNCTVLVTAPPDSPLQSVGPAPLQPGKPTFGSRALVTLELAAGHINLGSLFSKTGRPEQAETAFTEALAIQKRLAGARRELARVDEYQYIVINDDLDNAVAELRAIVRRHFERNAHAG